MTGDDSLIQLAAAIEAIIFAAPKPVRGSELQAQLPEGMELQSVLPLIEARFDGTSGIELCRVGDGFAFRTRAEITERLNTHRQVERPLSRAALEVLAIVAYHQPITRAEIEEVRGISLSRGTIDILLELGWIKPRGRRRTPGRPLTWGTSPAFLDHFGLETLTDLPGLDDLKAAGLLRKGQVFGGLIDGVTVGDDEDEEMIDDMIDEEGPDLLEEAMIDAGLGIDDEGEGHADA